MKISAVIPTWNRYNYLERCVKSIYKCNDDIEIICVDNNSTDGTLEKIRRKFPIVKIVSLNKNTGNAEGFNKGAVTASGDIVIMMDNDIEILNQDFFVVMRKKFAENPSFGIIGAKLFYPDLEHIQHNGGIIHPNAMTSHIDYKIQIGITDAPDFEECSYVTGALMAVKREVINKIGLLDESFSPGYFEETDYCTRAFKAGFKIGIARELTAIHYEGTSFGKKDFFFFNYSKSRIKYIFKHFPIKFFPKAAIEEILWMINPKFFRVNIQIIRAYMDAVLNMRKFLLMRFKNKPSRKLPHPAITPRKISFIQKTKFHFKSILLYINKYIKLFYDSDEYYKLINNFRWNARDSYSDNPAAVISATDDYRKYLKDKMFSLNNEKKYDMNKSIQEIEYKLKIPEPLSYPTSLEIETTSLCNYKCITCYHKYQNVRKETMDNRFLPIIESLLPYLDFVQFAGLGEPTMPQIFDDILEILQKGKAKIKLFTNSYFMNDKKSNLLFDCLIDRICLSLPAASKESYKFFTGADAFERVIENIKNMIRIRNKKSNPGLIGISAVCVKSNLKEISQLVFLAKNLGLDFVSIQPAEIHLEELKKDSIYYYQMEANEEFDKAEKLAKELNISVSLPKKFECNENYSIWHSGERVNLKMCRRPWEWLHITAGGDINPCGYVSLDICKLNENGNFSSDIMKAWQSKPFRAFRANCNSSARWESCSNCMALPFKNMNKPDTHFQIKRDVPIHFSSFEEFLKYTPLIESANNPK